VPGWHAAMPSHTPGIPKLADQITKAIFAAVSAGQIDRLDVVFTGWQSGRGGVQRAALFPLDLSDLPKTTHDRPLTQLPAADLLDALGADYVHALVCKAALHAFAAENEARIEAMTAAGAQIARELKHFQATLQRVRQEAITAEIIELGTGVA
jgi:F-type H+-transporting ATPase subunit gamma